MDFTPPHAPLAEQDVSLVEDHVSVVEPPEVTLVGEAENVKVGTGVREEGGGSVVVVVVVVAAVVVVAVPAPLLFVVPEDRGLIVRFKIQPVLVPDLTYAPAKVKFRTVPLKSLFQLSNVPENPELNKFVFNGASKSRLLFEFGYKLICPSGTNGFLRYPEAFIYVPITFLPRLFACIGFAENTALPMTICL